MATHFPEDTQLASRYVKQAIPLMMKNGVTPNPCNFALWYAYVTKRDLQLNAALDKALTEDDGFSEENSRSLFRKFIMQEEIELQENLQESLTNVLRELVGNVEKAKNGANSFQRSLEEGLENISGRPENTSLEDTIKGLIETTKSVQFVADSFQGQLNSAEDEIMELKRQLDEKEQDAYMDALTGIGNRRAFDKRMVELFQQSESEVTLVLVDLDHFKKLNDTYGHLMGDKVLQGIGQILQSLCPQNALAARYGGEEFAFLIEGAQDSAGKLVEKVQAAMGKLVLKKKNSGEVISNITASFGIAQKVDAEFPENLIERADKALYAAKEGGRDQMQFAA